jgi:hypothetical protein
MSFHSSISLEELRKNLLYPSSNSYGSSSSSFQKSLIDKSINTLLDNVTEDSFTSSIVCLNQLEAGVKNMKKISNVVRGSYVKLTVSWDYQGESYQPITSAVDSSFPYRYGVCCIARFLIVWDRFSKTKLPALSDILSTFDKNGNQNLLTFTDSTKNPPVTTTSTTTVPLEAPMNKSNTRRFIILRDQYVLFGDPSYGGSGSDIIHSGYGSSPAQYTHTYSIDLSKELSRKNVLFSEQKSTYQILQANAVNNPAIPESGSLLAVVYSSKPNLHTIMNSAFYYSNE